MGNNKKRGFTLIELLVVISIIALLSSIVLVALKGAREKAQLAKALQWARSIKAQLGGDVVGDWNFNEGTGRTVYSATGYNNGTLGGTTSCTAGQCPGGSTGACPCWADGVQGLTGKALYFDGSDDYVRVPANLRFQTIHGPSTLELWFNANSLSGTKRIFSDNCFEWGIYHNGSTLYGAAYSGVNGGTISTGQWYHVALTHEHPTGLTNTIIKIYVNGVLKAQTNWTWTTQNGYTDSPYWIGDDDCYVGYEFNGTIDEVRIYNQALTAMEIQKHYAGGVEKYGIVLK